MCLTLYVHLRSCSLSIISTPVSSRTSKTPGWIPRRQCRCRQYRSWCMWVQRHTHSVVGKRCIAGGFVSISITWCQSLVFGSGSGAAGLRSHRIRKDFGFLSPAAGPPAAAGQPGLQSCDHFSNQRAGQSGTHTHTYTGCLMKYLGMFFSFTFYHQAVCYDRPPYLLILRKETWTWASTCFPSSIQLEIQHKLFLLNDHLHICMYFEHISVIFVVLCLDLQRAASPVRGSRI